eukprot:4308285-Amphidinium_carterae.1
MVAESGHWTWSGFLEVSLPEASLHALLFLSTHWSVEASSCASSKPLPEVYPRVHSPVHSVRSLGSKVSWDGCAISLH